MKIFIYFDNHIKIIIFWQQYFWARKNFECITKLIRMRTEKDCERGESNSMMLRVMWRTWFEASRYVVSCIGAVLVHFDVRLDRDWSRMSYHIQMFIGHGCSVYICAALSEKLRCYYCKMLLLRAICTLLKSD